MRASGDITSNYSDIRLKTNIQPIENCIEKIQRLSGIYFTPNLLAKQYGYHEDKRNIGLIAQQVEPHIPEVITIAPFDQNSQGESKSGHRYLAIKYEKLVPIIVQAIKEQQIEISKLLSKIKKDTQ